MDTRGSAPRQLLRERHTISRVYVLTYRSTAVSMDPAKVNPTQQKKWSGATSQISRINFTTTDADALIVLIFWAIWDTSPSLWRFHQYSFRKLAILHIPMFRYRIPWSREATGSSSVLSLESGVCTITTRNGKGGGAERRVYCGKRFINRSSPRVLLNCMYTFLMTRRRRLFPVGGTSGPEKKQLA